LNLNLNFWIKSNWQKPIQPIWPPGPNQPTRRGLAARLGSGSNHRPSPAPVASPLSPPTTLWRPGSPPPLPGRSGRLRRPSPSPPRAKCSPQHPLPPPPNRFSGRFLRKEIGDWISLRDAPLCRRRLHISPDFFAGQAVRACSGLGVCVHASGSAVVVLPAVLR
jgi:hypothetical protein